MPKKYKRGLILPDAHVPFACKRYNKIIEKVITDYKQEIDFVVHLGDLIDAPQISFYDKDPRRLNLLEDDIDSARRLLLQWQTKTKPQCKWHLLEGNHEFRLRKYIIKNCNAISGLVPYWNELLDINNLPRDTTWHSYDKWDSCIISNTILTHGVLFSKHIAVNNLTKYTKVLPGGNNIIQGHTHRYQYASDGRHWSASLGHGAQAYTISHLNTPIEWQQAFAFLHCVDGQDYLEVHLVHNYQTIINGKVYKG